MSKAKAAKQPRQHTAQRREGGPSTFDQSNASLNVTAEPLLNSLPDEDQVHAAWLNERQAEERAQSLIWRLDQLARDARIERLEAAASLLLSTADELRIALSRDRVVTARKAGPR